MSTITVPAVTLTDITSACVAFQQGKIDKLQLIQFASSRQTDTAPLLKLMVDGSLTMPEVSGIIAAQQALAATPARQPGALHFKVSDKGAVSVYGLQARFWAAETQDAAFPDSAATWGWDGEEYSLRSALDAMQDHIELCCVCTSS